MNTLRSMVDAVSGDPRVNFTVTNRIPRRLLTRLVARVSRIENRLLYRLSMALWEMGAGSLHLEEAERSDFRSVHECFVRRLKPGARAIDPTPGALVSPCDGIVVSAGRIVKGTLIQAKGQSYSLAELLAGGEDAERFEHGHYVTLRLTAAMYHRFHAPADCRVNRVVYVPGDTWNVNPPALARIDRLYCRNTRVIVPCTPAGHDEPVVMVAVGAILVASVQLLFLPFALDETYAGRPLIRCDVAFRKGEEMGFFQHGSTMVVVAPDGFRPDAALTTGDTVRMGQRLFCQADRQPVSPASRASGSSSK
jgi:phosphatidylserine decarboxylase